MVMDDFKSAMRGRGIIPPAEIIADGKIHRADIDSPNGRGDGAYFLHPDGIPVGGFENWQDGRGWETWRADPRREMSPEEREAQREKMGAARRQRDAENKRRKNEARFKAEAIWKTARPVNGDHPYLSRKRVQACQGLRAGRWEQRLKDGCILVPMYDADGVLWNLQAIFPEKDPVLGRDKDFLYGARKHGLYFPIGTPDETLCITEGLATGLSVNAATGFAVAVAFDCGNLEAAACELRAKFPQFRIVVCADDDAETAGNPGLAKATEAARKIGGFLAVPDFGGDRPKGASDFNDLSQKSGLDSVREQIEMALSKQNLPGGKTVEEELKLLAALPEHEYEAVRKEKARCLNWRVAVLDNAIEELRKKQSNHQQSDAMFPIVEPWPDPVDGKALLDELSSTLERFCILPEYGATAAALWSLFTWCLSAFSISPRLLLSSPTRRCGKSTVFSILGRLVCRNLSCSNITSAAIFRSIELWIPTLLIDEADTFLTNDDEMRGVLNSGHIRENAFVIRVEGEGKDREPRKFSTWAPVAIAMIGKPKGTIIDRSIVLEMRRKKPEEKVETLRHATKSIFNNLRRKCLRWAIDHIDSMTMLQPEMPETLNDRQADNWEPLFAIAAIAGGDWPEKARTAAMGLSGVDDADEGDSLRVTLLGDIRDFFKKNHLDKVKTTELLSHLNSLEERKWPEYNHGKPLNALGLSRMLTPFGIKPKVLRYGTDTQRGYLPEMFDDAFRRYLPETGVAAGQDGQISISLAEGVFNPKHPKHPKHSMESMGCDDPDFSLFRIGDKPNSYKINDVSGVSVVTGKKGVPANIHNNAADITLRPGLCESRAAWLQLSLDDLAVQISGRLDEIGQNNDDPVLDCMGRVWEDKRREENRVESRSHN